GKADAETPQFCTVRALYRSHQVKSLTGWGHNLLLGARCCWPELQELENDGQHMVTSSCQSQFRGKPNVSRYVMYRRTCVTVDHDAIFKSMNIKCVDPIG
uniref:Uncharacterized protein n=1 Tax=Triticum urartu TaxID=4572 RepID=A0A8R7PR39_TRIUA